MILPYKEHKLYFGLREVDSMINLEYFRELEIKVRMQEALEDGLEKGRTEGIQQGEKVEKSINTIVDNLILSY